MLLVTWLIYCLIRVKNPFRTAISPFPSLLTGLMADSRLIVFGPRKRKENSRFADNGDPGPLPRVKKAKMTTKSATENVPMCQGSPKSTDQFSKGVDGGNADEDSLENNSEDPCEGPIDVDEEVDEILEESVDEELGGSN